MFFTGKTYRSASKEVTVNHATSYEILCEKNPRIEVKFSHLKSPVSEMVIIRKQLTKEADRSKVMEIVNSFKITSKILRRKYS